MTFSSRTQLNKIIILSSIKIAFHESFTVKHALEHEVLFQVLSLTWLQRPLQPVLYQRQRYVGIPLFVRRRFNDLKDAAEVEKEHFYPVFGQSIQNIRSPRRRST